MLTDFTRKMLVPPPICLVTGKSGFVLTPV